MIRGRVAYYGERHLGRLGVIAQLQGRGLRMDAIREVGPGGHYLGCAHTQANFKDAFWRSDLLDYKPFETWDEDVALLDHGSQFRQTAPLAAQGM